MKNVAVLVFLILCLSFGSAYEVDYKEKFVQTKYFGNDNLLISKTIWADYDNDDRHSTYDYRHGYTYRETEDYFNRMHDDLFYDYDKKDLKKINYNYYRDDDKWDRWDDDSWSRDYRDHRDSDRNRGGGDWDWRRYQNRDWGFDDDDRDWDRKRRDWDRDDRDWDRDRYYRDDDRHYRYDDRHDRYDRYDNWRYRGYDLKKSYYEYVPHLRDYEKKECYLNPPKDKLFYIKC